MLQGLRDDFNLGTININNKDFNYVPLIARGKKKELSFGTAYANKSSEDKNKIIFQMNKLIDLFL